MTRTRVALALLALLEITALTCAALGAWITAHEHHCCPACEAADEKDGAA